MSKWVRIGSVRVCDGAKPDKAQALKVVEEAAEVFGAYQEWDKYHSQHASFDRPKAQAAAAMKKQILSECADVIQAVAGLVHALGVEDFRSWIDRCEQRQRERGRITDGETPVTRGSQEDF